MKKIPITILVALFCVLCSADRYVPGRILVMWEPEPRIEFKTNGNNILKSGITDIDELMRKYRFIRARRIINDDVPNKQIREMRYHGRNLFLLECEDFNLDVFSACEDFKKLPNVMFAEPDWLSPKFETTPNDQYFSQQWHLTKIEAPSVWDFTTGSNQIIITVLEGMSWDHPDLLNNIWINPGEDINHNGSFDYSDLDGIDNDGNGYIDDIIGYDFIDLPPDHADPHPNEDAHDPDWNPYDSLQGHGNICSGIICAVSNNTIGVSGVAWNARIMVLRSDYTQADGTGTHERSAEIEALQYGYEKGCDVFSLSYGGYQSDPMANYWINRGWTMYNAIFFGAAGNEETDQISYPAGYPNVIAVAATDQFDRHAYFTNYGTWVDICAPGVHIWSTDKLDTYSNTEGTSMSTPVAAGIAVLLWSLFPDSSNSFVRQRIEAGTDSISDTYFTSGWLGTGRVNAAKAACKWIFPGLIVESFNIMDEDGNGRVTPGEEGWLYINFFNKPDWQTASGIEVRAICNDPAIEFIEDTAHLQTIFPGEFGQLITPIHFRMNPDLPEPHVVTVYIRLENTSINYVTRFAIQFDLGFYPILLYDCDGEGNYETYIAGSVTNGGLPYEYWNKNTAGELSETHLNYHECLLVFTGNTETNIFSSTEISLFSGFLDNGKTLILTGQYLPEWLSVNAPDFVTNYIGAQHILDTTRLWLLNILGVEGDPISNGMRMNAIYTSDAAGNQTETGVCSPIGDAIGFLRYQADTNPTHFAAVRKLLPSGGKAILFEFGLEGISSGGTGYHPRDTLVSRLLRWLGYNYGGVEEQFSLVKPEEISIKISPNPFNSSTAINIFADGQWTAKIVDFSGKQVRNLGTGHGNSRIIWNGLDDYGATVSSGMYFVLVKTRRHEAGTKIILIR